MVIYAIINPVIYAVFMEVEDFHPPVVPEESRANPYWEAHRARRSGNIKAVIACVIGLVGGAFSHNAWYGEAARKKLLELDREMIRYSDSTEEFLALGHQLKREREGQQKDYEERMRLLEETYRKNGDALYKDYAGALRTERAAYRKATKAWENAANQMNPGARIRVIETAP